MAAVALWYWYTNTEGIILVTATTNYAVQNLAKSLFECVSSLPTSHLLFLQSTTAELILIREEKEAWSNCRIPELLQVVWKKTREHMEKDKRMNDKI